VVLPGLERSSPDHAYLVYAGDETVQRKPHVALAGAAIGKIVSSPDQDHCEARGIRSSIWSRTAAGSVILDDSRGRVLPCGFFTSGIEGERNG
jgi:hypothetical protein